MLRTSAISFCYLTWRREISTVHPTISPQCSSNITSRGVKSSSGITALEQAILETQNFTPGLSLNLCLFWHTLSLAGLLQGLKHPRPKLNFQIWPLILCYPPQEIHLVMRRLVLLLRVVRSSILVINFQCLLLHMPLILEGLPCWSFIFNLLLPRTFEFLAIDNYYCRILMAGSHSPQEPITSTIRRIRCAVLPCLTSEAE